MTHPPRETLRSYAEGQTDVTRRLLVEAHLALCPSCLACGHSCDTAALPPPLPAALPPPSGWRCLLAWTQRVKFALLIRDADTGDQLYLTHFSPGSTFPRHRHLGLEENVILAGGYQSGDVHVDAGDWVIGVPDTEEMPRTAPDEECWCLTRIEPPGVRFTGWRRWVAPLFSR
jgi:anti-sigma factor ChrR (cupin superfamily)